MIAFFAKVWENFPLPSKFCSLRKLNLATLPTTCNASPTNPRKKTLIAPNDAHRLNRTTVAFAFRKTQTRIA
jgi:hypothetical protein